MNNIKIAEYQRQQDALRQAALAQYQARCEQQRRENLAGWVRLLPVLGAVLGVGGGLLVLAREIVGLLLGR